jgi:hypothetical protein
MESARTATRLFAVYSERLAGRASRQELQDAVQQARGARAAWGRDAGPPVDLRDVERRQVFDTLRLRIEGGSRYLAGPIEANWRALLETAASRAAGLPEGPDRRLAVVAWPAGRDLQAIVYFSQRSGPEAPPNAFDAERLRDALEARLRDEVRRLAPSLDPTAATRVDQLGRIDVRLPERVPALERVTRQPDRREEPATEVSAPALVVTLDHAYENEALATAAGRGHGEAPSEREQPREHDWSDERAVTIRLRIPTGTEQIERMDLSPEEAAHVVQRAVDRAYPFLEREGLRGNVLYAPRGRALDVQVVVPERLGWTPNQLRSPQFQQRFMTGFHQALSQVGPTPLGQARQPMLPGLARGVAAVGQAPQLLRRAEQDPERAAKDLARAVFSKLSEALPKPFRLMRNLSRTVSRFVPRG